MTPTGWKRSVEPKRKTGGGEHHGEVLHRRFSLEQVRGIELSAEENVVYDAFEILLAS